MKAGADKAAAPATGGPIVSTKGADGKRLITMAEVEQHSSDKDVWIVVKDKVYDATPFLDQHPGGSASITMNAGQDTTEDFTAVHSAKAWKDLEAYYIGDLVEEGAAPAAVRGEKGSQLFQKKSVREGEGERQRKNQSMP